MPKVYYVSEETKGIDKINFFKTEKEAQKHGKSDWVNTQSGLLMTWEEDRVYLQSSDDEEARKFIRSSKHDKQGSAIFFDSFKKGMHGSLGNDFAEGEGYTWKHHRKEYINESITIMKHVLLFEQFVNEADAALKKEIKEAKKELKQLQKGYAELDDNCGDLRSEIVDLKNDIKDGDDEDMIDMAKEQLEEKEEELELCQNDLDQCKMELDEVKDWLKNPS